MGLIEDWIRAGIYGSQVRQTVNEAISELKKGPEKECDSCGRLYVKGGARCKAFHLTRTRFILCSKCIRNCKRCSKVYCPKHSGLSGHECGGITLSSIDRKIANMKHKAVAGPASAIGIGEAIGAAAVYGLIRNKRVSSKTETSIRRQKITMSNGEYSCIKCKEYVGPLRKYCLKCGRKQRR